MEFEKLDDDLKEIFGQYINGLNKPGVKIINTAVMNDVIAAKKHLQDIYGECVGVDIDYELNLCSVFIKAQKPIVISSPDISPALLSAHSIDIYPTDDGCIVTMFGFDHILVGEHG